MFQMVIFLKSTSFNLTYIHLINGTEISICKGHYHIYHPPPLDQNFLTRSTFEI